MENPTEEANDKFLFFEGYYKAAKELPPKRQLAFYNAIMAYAFYGKPLPKGGQDAALFALIQASLDKSIELSQSGRRGGLKGGKSRSEAKIAAVRENGKLGGRPPKTEKLKPKPKPKPENPSETQAKPKPKNPSRKPNGGKERERERETFPPHPPIERKRKRKNTPPHTQRDARARGGLDARHGGRNAQGERGAGLGAALSTAVSL